MAEAHRHILLVEDDDATRECMVVLLGLQGYTVTEATNGREALDRLRHGERPRLILLDLMMPVMDGRQFRDEQRRDPDLADIPVVVVSADAAVDQKAAALEAAGHLQKPIDINHLLELLRGRAGTDPEPAGTGP